MGRPSNKAQRRAQIAEAAIRVIAEVGFDAASTQVIAREAGLSTGLVHHHFASKAEVLDEVLRTLAAKLRAREAELVGSYRGPWAELNAFIDANLALGAGASPQAARAWMWLGAKALEGGPLSESYAQAQAERHLRLVRILRRLAKHGARRHGLRSLATDLLCLIDGHFHLAATSELITPGTAAKRVRRSARLLLEVGVSR